MSRLDDTTRCPIADQCATCGGSEHLAVATLQTSVGVYCATLCDDCMDAGRLPERPAVATAVDLVLRHCEHIGLDADQAAALLEAERDGNGGELP